MIIKSSSRSIDLVNSVEKSLIKNQLIKKKEKILFSISGGQDSICLLAILNQLSAQVDFSTGLIWCHHLWQLDSFLLMRQITKISYLFKKNIYLAIATKPVPSELLARNWRHNCSSRISFFYKYNKISLAHSANDKAETILLNLMRGTGIAGLSPLVWKKINHEKKNRVSHFPFFTVFLFMWSPFFVLSNEKKKKSRKIAKCLIKRVKKINGVHFHRLGISCFLLFSDVLQSIIVDPIVIEIQKKFNSKNYTHQKLSSGKSIDFVDEISWVVEKVVLKKYKLKKNSKIHKKIKSKPWFYFVSYTFFKVCPIPLGQLEKKRKIYSNGIVISSQCFSQSLQPLHYFTNFVSTVKSKISNQKPFVVQLSTREKSQIVVKSCAVRAKQSVQPVQSVQPLVVTQSLQPNVFGFDQLCFCRTTITTKGFWFDTTFFTIIAFTKGDSFGCTDCFARAAQRCKKDAQPSSDAPACNQSLQPLQPKVFGFDQLCFCIEDAQSFSLQSLQPLQPVQPLQPLQSVQPLQPSVAQIASHVQHKESLLVKAQIASHVQHKIANKIVMISNKKERKGTKNKLQSTNYWQGSSQESKTDVILGKDKFSTIRPLLSLNRFDISKLCLFWQLPIYPDKSNQKLNFLRNRVRKQLIPIIKFFFNVRIEHVLLQFAEIFSAEDFYMSQITTKFFKKLSKAECICIFDAQNMYQPQFFLSSFILPRRQNNKIGFNHSICCTLKNYNNWVCSYMNFGRTICATKGITFDESNDWLHSSATQDCNNFKSSKSYFVISVSCEKKLTQPVLSHKKKSNEHTGSTIHKSLFFALKNQLNLSGNIIENETNFFILLVKSGHSKITKDLSMVAVRDFWSKPKITSEPVMLQKLLEWKRIETFFHCGRFKSINDKSLQQKNTAVEGEFFSYSLRFLKVSIFSIKHKTEKLFINPSSLTCVNRIQSINNNYNDFSLHYKHCNFVLLNFCTSCAPYFLHQLPHINDVCVKCTFVDIQQFIQNVIPTSVIGDLVKTVGEKSRFCFLQFLIVQSKLTQEQLFVQNVELYKLYECTNQLQNSSVIYAVQFFSPIVQYKLCFCYTMCVTYIIFACTNYKSCSDCCIFHLLPFTENYKVIRSLGLSVQPKAFVRPSASHESHQKLQDVQSDVQKLTTKVANVRERNLFIDFFCFFQPLPKINNVLKKVYVSSLHEKTKKATHVKNTISFPLLSILVNKKKIKTVLLRLVEREKQNQVRKLLKNKFGFSYVDQEESLFSHLYNNFFVINYVDHQKLILNLSWTNSEFIKSTAPFSGLINFKIGDSCGLFNLYNQRLYRLRQLKKNRITTFCSLTTISRFSVPVGATFWVWNRKLCWGRRKKGYSRNGVTLLSTFNRGFSTFQPSNIFNTVLQTHDNSKIRKSQNSHKIEKSHGKRNFLLNFDKLGQDKKEIYWPLIISFLPSAIQRRFIKLFLVDRNLKQIEYSQIEQFLTVLKKFYSL